MLRLLKFFGILNSQSIPLMSGELYLQKRFNIWAHLTQITSPIREKYFTVLIRKLSWNNLLQNNDRKFLL